MIIDGAGGKGTWGKLLDTDGESFLDRNDPNYDSGEVIIKLVVCKFFGYSDSCSSVERSSQLILTILVSYDLNRSLMSLLDQLFLILWMSTRKL